MKALSIKTLTLLQRVTQRRQAAIHKEEAAYTAKMQIAGETVGIVEPEVNQENLLRLQYTRKPAEYSANDKDTIELTIFRTTKGS